MTTYRKLAIGTKAQANGMLVESLFKPVNGRTLHRARWDLGKYKPGSHVGLEMNVPETVHALWMERRKDSDGPYSALFCLSSFSS